jgi:hypothetical protein
MLNPPSSAKVATSCSANPLVESASLAWELPGEERATDNIKVFSSFLAIALYEQAPEPATLWRA